jgi:hypothetical protein
MYTVMNLVNVFITVFYKILRKEHIRKKHFPDEEAKGAEWGERRLLGSSEPCQ